MNLHRYDPVLERANSLQPGPSRLQKCIGEMAELMVELNMNIEGRGNNTENIADEAADVLLTVRGIILQLDIEKQVKERMEFKAKRLHQRILDGGPL